MPKILNHDLPAGAMFYLIQRVGDRDISAAQLQMLSDWMNEGPEVPHGRWFKRFLGMTACGEGEMVKTFLLPHQAATGEEVL